MAHVDKIFKKDRLEKNILQLINDFRDETGCVVTDISASKAKFTDTKGVEHSWVYGVSVVIKPKI